MENFSLTNLKKTLNQKIMSKRIAKKVMVIGWDAADWKFIRSRFR